MSVYLEDYTTVDGVRMARRTIREPESMAICRFGQGDAEEARYRFNVAYDPAVFENAAPANVKRDSWKAK